MRARYGLGVWAGPIAYSLALLGTRLLTNEIVRSWAVSILIISAVLAVALWRRQDWIPAFSADGAARMRGTRSGLSYFLVVTVAVLFVFVADLRYATNPDETFGLTGILWVAGIGLLVCSALFGSTPHVPRWPTWEIALLAVLFSLALLTRVWKLADFPNNIYPDEIMTGTVATQSYISPATAPPSVFSTLWSGIDLPAFWFWFVAEFLRIGGTSLAMLRLPAALFGAATIVPLYGLIRGTWGRYAAIAGSAIMAFSASNVHYSRLALNNIVTQFFWATCFFFILQGLRSRRRSDWALAGLAGGLSEYFYYGTRLLPFILALFLVFLLVVHWKEARHYANGFFLLAAGYFAGFGPLLIHFIRNPSLYLGRGASLLIWSPHIPIRFLDFYNASKTIWLAFSENLLGISTHGSQDIIFYAPLLLPAENALLVLGVALLLWNWRHPAAFLILISGLGVLLVGGTLVRYPNSVPPLINHWTPAFPAFYVALAVPVGAWMAESHSELEPRLRWILPTTVALAVLVFGWCNLNFYFHRYYADPESLKSTAYRSAQRNYEVQTAQSRYSASLGPKYEVFTAGQSPWPYDPSTTRYLVSDQKWKQLTNPATELASITWDNMGVAFLFFPGNEQYLQSAHELFPGGTDGEVTNQRGKHLFYTYVLAPRRVEAKQK
jgi:dolichyl-phosphate-mannose-protein mannosyltransferase